MSGRRIIGIDIEYRI